MNHGPETLTPEKQGLKRAQLQLVQAVGGFEAAAGFCRVGKSQLHNATSVNDAITFLPADVIADLEAVTVGTVGHPVVTRYLASRQGFELFALPAAATAAGVAGASVCWHAMLARLAKEGGDVMPSAPPMPPRASAPPKSASAA